MQFDHRQVEIEAKSFRHFDNGTIEIEARLVLRRRRGDQPAIVSDGKEYADLHFYLLGRAGQTARELSDGTDEQSDRAAASRQEATRVIAPISVAGRAQMGAVPDPPGDRNSRQRRAHGFLDLPTIPTQSEGVVVTWNWFRAHTCFHRRRDWQVRPR